MNNDKKQVTFFINKENGFERIEQGVDVSSGVDSNYHPENYYG